MYVIWVDEGDGWYIYKETNHWPDVQKSLDCFDYCYYASHFEDAYIIAEPANQINYERNGHHRNLFSEGLY